MNYTVVIRLEHNTDCINIHFVPSGQHKCPDIEPSSMTDGADTLSTEPARHLYLIASALYGTGNI